MNQTVIGEIYDSLSKKELKDLTKFITTSQWQYSDTIVKSHTILQQFKLKGKLERLTKEEIFLFVYDREEYNDSKLRFTLNRLVSAIKEFIAYTEFEAKNIFLEKVWMDFLIKKKLKKNIQYNIENTVETASSDYKFLYSYFKCQENNFHKFHFTKDTKSQYDSIIEIMRSAEVFSDLVFLKNYSLLISFTNIYQSDEFTLPIEKFNEIKAKKWATELPEFVVYMSLIDLLVRKNIDSYNSFKENLFKYFSIWDDDGKISLIIYLMNFTTSQINKGDVQFIDEQYDLYIFFEENGIFQIPNYINTTRINNVVHIFLRKKDYTRAEEFVNKYVGLLSNDLIESCRHFNIARIKFENGLYKTSLRELLQVDFGRDTFYSINSKFLLAKTYYELKESEALDSLCQSFKEYIRKNKVISETYKTSCLNFIKTLEKGYGATRSKAEKLKLEISQSTQIAEKNWLLEKINEKLA